MNTPNSKLITLDGLLGIADTSNDNGVIEVKLAEL